MGEIVLLALGSALWPLLIAITVIALQAPNPTPLLLMFLVGGLLATISIGVAIVLLLSGTSLVDRSRPPLDPVLDFVVAGLMFLVAYALARSQARLKAASRQKPVAKPDSSWAERALAHGAPLAFVFGILLNLVPGFLPLVALKDIAELDVGTVSVILIVTGFYIVMFAFVEIPLVGFLFAPRQTKRLTARFNLWLSANGRRVCAWIAAGAGVYLTVRGIVAVV
jgi:Sap, sulfolipid-1-addressing protein